MVNKIEFYTAVDRVTMFINHEAAAVIYYDNDCHQAVVWGSDFNLKSGLIRIRYNSPTVSIKDVQTDIEMLMLDWSTYSENV